MADHKGLPVAGYKPQADDKIKLVNKNKQIEERIMRDMDNACDVDRRWLAIARTQMEQAFMAYNRAIFQPGRVELPEDGDDYRGTQETMNVV